MTKYNVGVTIYASISTVIEVEADSEEEADDKALHLATTDPRYSVKDFDGNVVEVLGDDVVIDSIDRGAP